MEPIRNCPDLMDAIQRIGLVPLLDSGIRGFSADELVAPECRYVAGVVTMDWWPDLCNYRRAKYPEPEEESIEGVILEVLRVNGSMITRDLRNACGFTGAKMRSRFDSYVTRLQMACRVVTEDFVYPHDKHGRQYGWGWALLNTPEHLFGIEACQCDRTPEESFARIMDHLRSLLPNASEKQLMKMMG